ncbi:glycosyltransferase family 4 protein [Mesonia maritima]|uniref:Glycosyltransferase involved in cell wall biosynthesis n=1 Tax=Mesonia maritima TaxID=1793873 RepID=A0ABU1K746_9FLAO|nr:glycosyltransferase family 4 protein [Mesonia maritima]MDR6301429.1 glycosyltransferase involved in cell wall biosynthesis [Mesonia maritima]
MRILFFTNEYAHPQLPAAGGVGTFFKTVAKDLASNGHQIFIYGFSKKNYFIEEQNIQITYFKQYSKKFPLAELFRSLSSKTGNEKAEKFWLMKERKYLAKKLKNFSKKNDIDIIQTFTFNGFSAYWDNSIPLVLRFHGSRGFWVKYLNHHGSDLKIEMEKKALQATPFTVANSNFSADFIEDFYNVKVKKIIRNGIDTNLFKPDRSAEIIPQSIFYFGTLSDAKGVDRLAAIFNKIIEEFPNATLHIIGKNKSYFQKLVANNFSEKAAKNIQYYGHVSLENLPKKVSQAALVIVPSKGETFGFTIVEAMALEKVTLVSTIPVAQEIIIQQKNGIIADTNDDFVKQISEVFKNPENYKAMEKAARQHVLENFSQERMVNETFAYYQEILNR